MNTTKSSATQVEAQDVVGLDPLAAALAKIERLTAENEARRRNMRETFDAMCAMRNSINEHLPMPSLESDLLQGPEDSIFCAAVAEAVVSALTVARAERDAALASSARAVVMGVWGMCEAIEDDAHEKIAMADCDHSKGFWTGQKLAAKTIRRSTEMPAQTTSTVQDAARVLLGSESSIDAIAQAMSSEPGGSVDVVTKALRAIAEQDGR